MSGAMTNWEDSFETMRGTNVDAYQALDALRTICEHALDLADALDIAAMCGLTQAQEDG
jgi:hypothetical protein